MNTRTTSLVIVVCLALTAGAAQADMFPGHDGGGYVRLTDDLTQGGVSAYGSTNAVSGLLQAWDGSSCTIETRMNVPTGDIDVGDVSASVWRAAGLLIHDTVHGHRYILGIRPNNNNDTAHYGLGGAVWENFGSVNGASGLYNMAGLTASDGWVDFRFAFNATTKVGDLYYRAPGDDWALLSSLSLPADFSPNRVGLSIWHVQTAGAGDLWAPGPDGQIDFDYFHITGGTGTAVSDDFTRASVSEALWYELNGSSGQGQGTTFEYVDTPEPATMGLLAIGGLGVLLRRGKRRA